MVNTIQNQKLFSLPSNYMMHAFGSESQMTKKTLTLVATLAAAYFSFQHLPPGVDMWVGGTVLVVGTALFIFGSLANVLEFVGGFFSRLPPPTSPSSYPPSRWTAHKTPPYHIPSPRLPPHYPQPPRTNPYDSPYVPPRTRKDPPRTVVHGNDGKTATLTPTFEHSGYRPRRKSIEEKKCRPHPPSDLSQSWHFGGSTSRTPTYGTPVHTKDGSAELHVGSRSNGRRPERKKA